MNLVNYSEVLLVMPKVTLWAIVSGHEQRKRSRRDEFINDM
jgi:hypothetical protein